MRLKRIVSLCCVLTFLTGAFAAGSFKCQALDLSAQSAVLMEANTREVLFRKNETKQLSMASTTKLMTALVTLDLADLSQQVQMTDEMVRVEGTSMGLKTGDVVSVEGLLNGLLLQSGNDAANALCLFLSQNEPQLFLDRMNRKAYELGMFQTHFATPSGLDDDNHYSTAYDMGLLGCEAVLNPQIRAITSQKTAQVTFFNKDLKVTYSNHNRLLREYEGTVGLKTGFTKKSGRCLVSAATRDGVTLVAVTLNAPNDWDDHKKMLNFGFETVGKRQITAGLPKTEIPVVGGVKNTCAISCEMQAEIPDFTGAQEKLIKTVELPRFIYAPVQPGQVLGKVSYYINGYPVAVGEIKAQEAVEFLPKETFWDKVKKFFHWPW